MTVTEDRVLASMLFCFWPFADWQNCTRCGQLVNIEDAFGSWAGPVPMGWVHEYGRCPE